jgi:hypothetical protein
MVLGQYLSDRGLNMNTRNIFFTTIGLVAAAASIALVQLSEAEAQVAASTYIPVGVGPVGGGSSPAAWIVDSSKNRIIYCYVTGANGAFSCKAQPLP